MISIIVASSENNVIGVDNTRPWHLPDDLKFFKNLTSGNAIIMGRKTYDSIGRPLPNRTNIIVTRNTDYKQEGCVVCNSLEEAVNAAEGKGFIIGGAEIYRQSIALADRIYLTKVHTVIEGDAYFEMPEGWQVIEKTFHPADEKHKFDFEFLTYEKI